jgi:hypothetical protein
MEILKFDGVVPAATQCAKNVGRSDRPREQLICSFHFASRRRFASKSGDAAKLSTRVLT